eukprot:619082-Rhodomonas_salina.3
MCIRDRSGPDSAREPQRPGWVTAGPASQPEWRDTEVGALLVGACQCHRIRVRLRLVTAWPRAAPGLRVSVSVSERSERSEPHRVPVTARRSTVTGTLAWVPKFKFRVGQVGIPTLPRPAEL